MDWKRRVFALYAGVRAGAGDPAALEDFRAAKDALFAEHPQSALLPGDRAGFTGLDYFAHDPAMRVEVPLEREEDGPALVIPTSTGEPTTFRRVGFVRPTVSGESISLAVYWL